MRLTTATIVTADGVMQGLGGPEEDRRGGSEHGGWAMPYNDNETMGFLNDVYGRADAFLLGRLTYEIFAGSWGRDTALESVGSRTMPSGVTIQVYRQTGRPQYGTATVD